ncbi:MAG: hypothetical protein WCD00_02995 [Desulfuromonadaceae bacterium]
MSRPLYHLSRMGARREINTPQDMSMLPVLETIQHPCGALNLPRIVDSPKLLQLMIKR